MDKENKQFKSYGKFLNKELSKDSNGMGVLKVSGWASKAYENGMPVVDRDSEHVDTKGFDLTNAKVMLYNHDWDEVIGKLSLSHRAEGIWLDGEIHEAMDKKAFYAAKEGILDSFSIGFTITDYEFLKVGGEDIVSFKSGSILEVSLVSIPANTRAMIENTEVIKSMVKDGECTGLQCSVKNLKAMNPDCGCLAEMEKNMEKDLSKKDIKTIIKGLTFEETEAESWTQARLLEYYMGVLITTIEDNFWESMWQDDMSGEDYKQNIIGALTAFGERLNELTVLDIQVPDVVMKEIKREIMTKEMETKTSEVVEIVEQTPTEEVTEILEGGEKDTPAEPVEPTTEQVEEQNSTEEKVEEQVSEEVDAPVEQSVTQPTVQTIIGTLATVNLDELSVEEIEAIYNTSADIIEKIEALVKADIEGDE